MKPNLLLLLAVAGALSGCASPRYFGDGQYQSAGYDEPEHMDDRFNEFDSHRLISAAMDQMSRCDARKRVVMVARLDNQTSEAIDLEAFQRELVDRLSSSGYSVIDKSSRPDLHLEYQYNRTGYVNPAKAAVTGRQEGVQVLIRAALESKVQSTEDDKTVRYRLSLQAVDAESALVTCSPAVEIKKRYHRTRVAL